MGTNVRQGIVTNGLVLHLDAANRKSYTETQEVWRDLSGNQITGSKTTATFPTYVTNNGGGLFFSGRGITLSQDNLRFGTGNFTVEIAVNISASISSGYQTIISTGNNLTNGATGSYFGVFVRGNSGNINFFNGLSGITSPNIPYTNNQPLIMVCTKQGNTMTTFSNGINIGSGTNVGAYDTTETNGTVVIGFNLTPSYVGQANMLGTIYSIKVYNRALSATEVAQNYNALKSRFGLS